MKHVALLALLAFGAICVQAQIPPALQNVLSTAASNAAQQVIKNNGDRGAANLAAQQAAQAAQKAGQDALKNGQSEAAAVDAAKKAGQQAVEKAATNVAALQKQSNPSGVTGIAPQVQQAVSKAAQQAAEAVVKQGGTKEQANAAAQKAAAAAVGAANKLQKENPNAPPQTLATVATDAATPVVSALSKNMNANVDSMIPKTPASAKTTEAAPKDTSTIAAPTPASPEATTPATTPATPASGSVGPSAAAVAAATGAAEGPEGLPPLANVTDNTTAENLPKQAPLNGTEAKNTTGALPGALTREVPAANATNTTAASNATSRDLNITEAPAPAPAAKSSAASLASGFVSLAAAGLLALML